MLDGLAQTFRTAGDRLALVLGDLTCEQPREPRRGVARLRLRSRAPGRRRRDRLVAPEAVEPAPQPPGQVEPEEQPGDTHPRAGDDRGREPRADDERQRLLDREGGDGQGEEQPGGRDDRRTELARRVADLRPAPRRGELEIPANEDREPVDEIAGEIVGRLSRSDRRCPLLGYRPASTVMRPSLPALTSSA